MLQCFSETGEPVQDFRVEFEFDELHPDGVRRIAHVEGSRHEFGRTNTDAFVGEINDPFWISTADHLYLNAEYDYSEALCDFMTDSIAARTRAEIEAISVTPLGLASIGLPLSAAQIELFRNGRPLWRRSALSCNPGRGEKRRSMTSNRLRDALLAWLVFCDLVARHAMQVDRTGDDTKFPDQTPEGLTNLTKSILANALGFSEGVEEGKSSLSANDSTAFPIGFPALGIEKLGLSKSARQPTSAFTDGRTKYFKKVFGVPRMKITTQIQAEMMDFKQVPRMYGAEFDAFAMIEWAGKILIYLRVALAASLKLDQSRKDARKKLLRANSDQARQRIVGDFTVKWLRGITGVQTDGTRRDLPLEELLDLQTVAFLAMATGMDPRLLFPYMNYGIYDEFDEETALTSQLFIGATWLGELFRKRAVPLDRAHAYAIVTSCNPGCLPRGLPQERKEEWIAATRLVTSFMTEAGLERLMEVANDVLNDGITREVVALEPAQWRATPSKKARAKQKKRSVVETLRGAPPFLPAPIGVEAGWLLLPGDYQDGWVGQSGPF
jgi:hypothetical protein